MKYRFLEQKRLGVDRRPATIVGSRTFLPSRTHCFHAKLVRRRTSREATGWLPEAGWLATQKTTTCGSAAMAGRPIIAGFLATGGYYLFRCAAVRIERSLYKTHGRHDPRKLKNDTTDDDDVFRPSQLAPSSSRTHPRPPKQAAMLLANSKAALSPTTRSSY